MKSPIHVILLALLTIPGFVHAEKVATGGSKAAVTQPKRRPEPNASSQPYPAAPAQGMQTQAPSTSQPATGNSPARSQMAPGYSGATQTATTARIKPLSKKQERELEKRKLEEKALEYKIQAWTAGGPTRNTDWDSYEYPKNYRGWSSGDVGLENIGNGMCTGKNAERSQMKLGYCKMLADILREEGSCANTAIKTILPRANKGSFGDLHLYCSNWHSLNEDAKIQAFVQVLAGLITKESGWNPNATEQPWVRTDGKHMGGMGLFQIGVNDRSKDKDCAQLTATAIFDPRANIRCGSCIALKYAARDFTMGNGTGDRGARGIAVYFSPFRDHNENPPSNKRPEIQMATQTFCRAGNVAEK